MEENCFRRATPRVKFTAESQLSERLLALLEVTETTMEFWAEGSLAAQWPGCWTVMEPCSASGKEEVAALGPVTAALQPGSHCQPPAKVTSRVWVSRLAGDRLEEADVTLGLRVRASDGRHAHCAPWPPGGSLPASLRAGCCLA